MMKRFFKSFTFYFMLLSLLMIFIHYKGQDPYGIVLFHLNIILKNLIYNESVNNLVKTGPKITCGSLTGEIYIYWYIAHFISFMIYGLVLDLIKFGIKKISKVSS